MRACGEWTSTKLSRISSELIRAVPANQLGHYPRSFFLDRTVPTTELGGARSEPRHGSQLPDCSRLLRGCGILSAVRDGPVLWIYGGQRFDARRPTLSMEVRNGTKTQGFNNGAYDRKKRRQAGNEW
jgi:hypothetical protein